VLPEWSVGLHTGVIFKEFCFILTPATNIENTEILKENAVY